jgi:hypothetical protein
MVQVGDLLLVLEDNTVSDLMGKEFPFKNFLAMNFTTRSFLSLVKIML